MANTCGTCTLCCKLIGVKELKKPAGKWCEFCKPGKGCMVYPDRPPSCIDFECGWLLSNLPVEFRPDNLHIIITGESNKVGAVILHQDPNFPNSVETKNGKRLLELFARDGKPVIIVTGDKRKLLSTSVKELELVKNLLNKTDGEKDGQD